MGRTRLQLFIGPFLTLVVLCLLAACQQKPSNLSGPPGSSGADLESRHAALTLEDVFGPHNPKMIGGWGGERTKEAWFLRCVRSPQRLDLLSTALDFFYAQNGSYPSDWDALEESGLYPIRPLDPIDGKAIVYGVAPESSDDFHRLTIETSYEDWSITGRLPEFPEGTWCEHTWEFEPCEGPCRTLIEQDVFRFPTPVALRGFMLAKILEHILWDYEHRRALMPAGAEEMLDGLWYVAEDWAAHDPAADAAQPGGFLFGVDSAEGLSVAIWHDETGKRYAEGWIWDPWPSGWEKPPRAGEQEGHHGLPSWDPIPDDFTPETVLWSCSLVE